MEKLPEKWCIKPKNENQLELIYNYGANEYFEAEGLEFYYHYPEFKPQCFARSYITKGYTIITFEQFKELVLKQNNMENNSIKINIPEGMEIDKEKISFGEIGFKNKEKKLPKTWEELEIIKGYYVTSLSGISELREDSADEAVKNVFPTKKLAKAALALAQLLQLRDVYNDGWIPNYNDYIDKNIICVHKNEITKDYFASYQFPLTFKTKELRDEFYDNFQDLLETANPLL